MASDYLDAGFVAYCNHTRLRSIFTGWREGAGLFGDFTSTPWGNTVDNSLLNFDYFGSHSGYKRPTPLVYDCLEYDQDGNIILSSTNRAKIASIIETHFKTKWQKLWDAYMTNFDPLNTFKIHQEFGGENSDEKTGDDTVTNSGQQSVSVTHGKVITNSGTDKATKTTTGSVSNAKTGSESIAQAGKEFFQQKGTESDTQTGKIQEANSDSDTTGVWGFGTSTNPADSTKITKGTKKDTTIDSNNPLTVAHSFGTGNDSRIDERSFGTGSDARKETHEFTNRTDTITYGADSEHPLTEENSIKNGKKITESGTTTTTTKIGDDNGNNLLKAKTEYNSTMTHNYDSTIDTTGYKDNPAKALRDYIAVWKNDYFNIVFADIDSIIAQQVY